jgi:hypothetical protein
MWATTAERQADALVGAQYTGRGISQERVRSSAACLMKSRLVFFNVEHPFPLEHSRLLQSIFHSPPALYGGSFGCARSAPVGLEAHDLMTAVAL